MVSVRGKVVEQVDGDTAEKHNYQAIYPTMGLGSTEKKEQP